MPRVVAIVDSRAGRHRGPEEIEEVWRRVYRVMKGYDGMPDETVRAIAQEG